ncbi:Adenylate kinase isoenzyme 1 [Aphelenchoides fujianensis]|nr:Adenylate kinase isoenzyme 1 [Aphelenchoides fujianensis]
MVSLVANTWYLVSKLLPGERPSANRSAAIDLGPLKRANVPIFFIVGAPGAGKGTQCQRIVEKYGLTHLSSGDLLRAEVASGSPLGAQLTQTMQAGELVSLEIVLDLVKVAMLKALAAGSEGIPDRRLPARCAAGRQIQPAKLVLFFDVSEETLVQRCLKRGETSGRSDDNIETVKLRLQTFKRSTEPVVLHYEKKGKLVRIIAEGTVEEIFAEVCKHLDKAIVH